LERKRKGQIWVIFWYNQKIGLAKVLHVKMTKKMKIKNDPYISDPENSVMSVILFTKMGKRGEFHI
jgi:hypothetical protein